MNKPLQTLIAMVAWVILAATGLTQQEQVGDSTKVIDADGAATIIVTGGKPAEPAFLFSASTTATARVGSKKIEQTIEARIKVVQGKANTVSLGINGPGEVLSVSGENLSSWSVRTQDGARFLDLQLIQPLELTTLTVSMASEFKELPAEVELRHWSQRIVSIVSRLRPEVESCYSWHATRHFRPQLNCRTPSSWANATRMANQSRSL